MNAPHAEYLRDRQWSDEMINEIKHIIGPFLLITAPEALDCHEATDLLLFSAKDMRIAARVRRSSYKDRYPFDFTIRGSRPSGTETEFSKIINRGFGDWFFYGHAADGCSVQNIGAWMLIDLHVVRRFVRDTYRRYGTLESLGTKKVNHDNTGFYAFDVRKFPEKTLVAAMGVPTDTLQWGTP